MKILEGTASNILKDFCDGKYYKTYQNEGETGRRFIDTVSGQVFALSEEVNFYLDILEDAEDNERWSGDTW